MMGLVFSQRSIEMLSPGIVLSTGLEVTDANRPRVPLAQTLFGPIMEAKAAVEGALRCAHAGGGGGVQCVGRMYSVWRCGGVAVWCGGVAVWSGGVVPWRGVVQWCAGRLRVSGVAHRG